MLNIRKISLTVLIALMGCSPSFDILSAQPASTQPSTSSVTAAPQYTLAADTLSQTTCGEIVLSGNVTISMTTSAFQGTLTAEHVRVQIGEHGPLKLIAKKHASLTNEADHLTVTGETIVLDFQEGTVEISGEIRELWHLSQ